MHRQILSQRLKEQFSTSLEYPFYEAPSSPALCPENSTILVSQTLIFVLSTQQDHQALFCAPPALLWLGNCLRTMSWGNCRPNFICFSSLRDHSPILPVVHCLKTIISYNWSSFLTVYSKRAISTGVRRWKWKV